MMHSSKGCSHGGAPASLEVPGRLRLVRPLVRSAGVGSAGSFPSPLAPRATKLMGDLVLVRGNCGDEQLPAPSAQMGLQRDQAAPMFLQIVVWAVGLICPHTYLSSHTHLIEL
mgnify:CR=1 FL=1|jgi:hypothetical protein